MRPRRLELSDLPALQALVAEAGWNQVGADWRLMLSRGIGLGLTPPDGPVVASAVALPHPPLPEGAGFGWISMVLVAGPWRRRGAARWLVRRCIEALRQRGCAAVLDATPAGQTLYAAMGFRPGPGLGRWTRPARAPEPAGLFRPLRAEHLPLVARLDSEAFGADRSAVLHALAARLPHAALGAWEGDALTGYALARDGRTATQLGPVVAQRPDIAAALLAAQTDLLGGALLVDAFDDPAVLAALQAQGFAEQRRFARMALGIPPAQSALAFAAAGPELG